jgi:hypothetical protein
MAMGKAATANEPVDYREISAAFRKAVFCSDGPAPESPHSQCPEAQHAPRIDPHRLMRALKGCLAAPEQDDKRQAGKRQIE